MISVVFSLILAPPYLQVEPMMLANVIIDAYNKRGALHEALLEDTLLGDQYQLVSNYYPEVF